MMSKSIYVESLKSISVEFNALELAERFELFELVEHALKQAQKQEKLLELYIDLANTIKVLDNAYGYEIFEFGEIKYICNKIKELENE